MADTINVNVGGARRSLLIKLIALIAIGYLACLGWWHYGPKRPQLDSTRTRWVEKVAKEIIADINNNKGDTVKTIAISKFSNDPSGRISEIIRDEIPEGVYVADKGILEKIGDALQLPINSKETTLTDENKVKLGKYAKSRSADAVIWATCCQLEIVDRVVVGEIKYYLVGADGNVIHDGVCDNKTLSDGGSSETTSTFIERIQTTIQEVGWPHRLLIWTLIILVFPLFTISFLKSVAKKRSNGSNAYTLILYTVIGAVLAIVLLPPDWNDIYSTLIFVGMVLGAGIYNLLMMDFARKLELE